jgi:perosamine synthetase
MIPAYKDHEEAVKAKVRNTIGYSISPCGINLPSGMNLDLEKVQYVCGALEEILANPVQTS